MKSLPVIVSRSESMSLFDLADRFPDEEAAVLWFEAQRWPDGVTCPRCESDCVSEVESRKPMKWRCGSCRKYFSVRTGTYMENSRVPVRKWVFASYLMSTSIHSVSSVELGHKIGVTQRTAWFMMHRLRGATRPPSEPMEGEIEVDETMVGGKYANMHKEKKETKPGKFVVVGAKSRTTGEVRCGVVPGRLYIPIERFVWNTVAPRATVYTDAFGAYNRLREAGYEHFSTDHEKYERVDKENPDNHTQGIESFWQRIKRAYKGTHHWMSEKHLGRYANEHAFNATHSALSNGEKMRLLAQRSVGANVTWAELTAS